MSRNFLRELDLLPGAVMADVRQAYKDLAFVWHPDRQPQRLKARATAKFQRITEAYEFFKASPAELERVPLDQTESEGTGVVLQIYTVSECRCPRCAGSGEFSTGVDRRSNFLSEPCPICQGSGRILADARNTCHSCKGSGKNPTANRQAMQDFIEKGLGDTAHLTRKQVQFRHRKLWVRFANEHQVCKACFGAGYFYYRPDLRSHENADISEDRRKSG